MTAETFCAGDRALYQQERRALGVCDQRFTAMGAWYWCGLGLGHDGPHQAYLYGPTGTAAGQTGEQLRTRGERA